MTDRVVSFSEARIAGLDYLFMLGAWGDPGPDQKSEDLGKGLIDALTQFGDLLENSATAVISIPKYSFDNAAVILDKSWPPQIKDLFRKADATNFLIVINVDFDRFDPKEHDVAILWLRKDNNIADIRNVCQDLARRVRQGVDLYEYFKSIFERIPYEKRGTYPGSWEQQKRAEDNLNFTAAGFDKLISLDVTILADNIARAPIASSGGMKLRLIAIRSWIDSKARHPVWSKLIADSIKYVVVALVVTLLAWLGFSFLLKE